MPNIKEEFELRGADDVSATVVVGDAHIDGIGLLLSGKRLAPVSEEESGVFELGSGADLMYEILTGTVVVKTLQHSKKTSVKVTVTQGATTETYPAAGQAGSTGLVRYGITIRFIRKKKDNG